MRGPAVVTHTMETLLARGVKQENGCITIGSDAPCRYWMVKHNGKQIHAHRLMLLLKLGELGPNDCACHHCDNPRCINPDHIYAATHAENMADCNAKGRRNHRTPKKFLQTHEVEAAKYLINAGFPKAQIAMFLGVHEISINRISAGRTHATKEAQAA